MDESERGGGPPRCDFCGAELTITLPTDDGGVAYKGCGDDETLRCVDCMTPEQRRDAARALDLADDGHRIRTDPREG